MARVTNAGISGDTTAGGRARLPRTLASLRRRPDLAILELGANDLLRGVPVAQMRDNLDWMLTEFARCDIPVLLAGMMAPAFLGNFAQGYNAVFPELAARHGTAFYPFFLEGVVGDAALVLADGIHPNARAVGMIAERILPHVRRALAAPGARAAA